MYYIICSCNIYIYIYIFIYPAPAGADGQPAGAAWETDALPFLHLTLDLPPTPLYADSLEKKIIPQVRAL